MIDETPLELTKKPRCYSMMAGNEEKKQDQMEQENNKKKNINKEQSFFEEEEEKDHENQSQLKNEPFFKPKDPAKVWKSSENDRIG